MAGQDPVSRPACVVSVVRNLPQYLQKVLQCVLWRVCGASLSAIVCGVIFIASHVSLMDWWICVSAAGKAVVHTYTAGNEPYSVWEGLQRGSKEYEDLKQQRAETLWKVSHPRPQRASIAQPCGAPASTSATMVSTCVESNLKSLSCKLTSACAVAAVVHPGFGALHS